MNESVPTSQAASADIAARLHQAGSRATAQRVVTWRAVQAAMPHPSVHDVFDRVRHELPSTTLRTVYATLHTFQELGWVRLLPVPGGARLDLEPVDHGHGWCERCGRLVNLVPGAEVFHTLAGGSFYASADVGAVVVGRCDRCSAAE